MGFPTPEAVGHRVVHGGPEHTAPERVDAQLLAELGRLVAFAPLHLPSAIQGIQALTAVLTGLDTLVSTGGIGERAAPVRWEVCRGLAYLGVELDPQKNAVHADFISTPKSACTVRVIPTDEDLMIACHTRTLLVSSEAAQRP